MIADPLAAFAMLFELGLWPQHLRHATNERESLAFEILFWALRVVQFRQGWFVIKQFKLRGRACHVQIDNRLRLGGNLPGLVVGVALARASSELSAIDPKPNPV